MLGAFLVERPGTRHCHASEPGRPGAGVKWVDRLAPSSVGSVSATPGGARRGEDRAPTARERIVRDGWKGSIRNVARDAKSSERGQPVGPRGSSGYPPDLLARVARLHFEFGLTHQETANSLGLSRVKVTRLVKQARESGLVTMVVASNVGPIRRARTGNGAALRPRRGTDCATRQRR